MSLGAEPPRAPARPYRLPVTWVVALLLVTLALGAGPLALSRGWAVRMIFIAAHRGAEPSPQALGMAESVRVSIDPLSVIYARGDPGVALAREGFGPTEISHLKDVRRVFGISLALTLISLAGLVVSLALAPRGARLAVLGASSTVALGMVILGMAAVSAIGAVAFEPLFAAFHSLFFAPGTWEFPADSLLIRLFPEPFWMLAGAWWAALAVALVAVVRLIAFLSTRTIASRARSLPLR
jgi:integral membrane protein (TIGR01906 family)